MSSSKKIKLTDKGVAALSLAKQNRYEVWEEGRTGLGLRISKQHKTWVFMYRFKGKAKRLTFGRYPGISVAEAREKQAQARKALDYGRDPGAENVEKNIADRNAISINALVDLYIEKWAKPRKKSAKEDQRILDKEVKSRWGTWKAKEVARKDIIKMLDEIVARGANTQANRTLAVARKMFNFAVDRELIELSPCYRVKPPAKEKQRERVLKPEEISAFWNNLVDADMTTVMQDVMRFMLVSAQRKSEILMMEWQELDLEANVWTIPAEKAKNGFAHRVPLSDLAVSLLKTRMGDKDQNDMDGWVFPSTRSDGPLTAPSVNHSMRDNLQKLKLSNVTPHDLRRTAATVMVSLGTPRLIVSKVLNHVDQGVTAIYDRHGYENEKKVVLDLWAAFILEQTQK